MPDTIQVVVDNGRRIGYCLEHRMPFNSPDAVLCRIAPIEQQHRCERVLWMEVGEQIELTEEREYAYRLPTYETQRWVTAWERLVKPEAVNDA